MYRLCLNTVEVADDSNILGRRLNEYLSVVLITL